MPWGVMELNLPLGSLLLPAMASLSITALGMIGSAYGSSSSSTQ